MRRADATILNPSDRNSLFMLRRVRGRALKLWIVQTSFPFKNGARAMLPATA